MRYLYFGFFVWALFSAFSASAHGPRPPSMIGAPIPPVPGLTDGADPIVIDKLKAIELGKALFWDINMGSDGMACASCHFHAGADRRVKNQLNPGNLQPSPSTGDTFESTASGGLGGPNYTLKRSDFPFFQFANPFDRLSTILSSTDDVASSSGTFSGDFTGAPRVGDSNDSCIRSVDPVFHVGAIGTRRVEPRNTPTVINAVFNHRNFWDGRANNIFNGSSPWGERDPDAGVWVKINGRTVQKQRLHLINSSLASQAVAPPLSDVEMGCKNRVFPDLGRKVLSRRPLEHQKVHWNDSVLGGLSFSSAGNLQPGLNTTYSTLIKQAFNSKYWSFRRRGQFGGPSGKLPYSQIEANFAMFFGIAIQLYETTLISDQAPIDTLPRNPQDFDPPEEALFPTEASIGTAAYNGLKIFIDLHCNLCHAGPALTSAAVTTNHAMVTADPNAFGPAHIALAVSVQDSVVNNDIHVTGSTRLIDTGYFNTGVGDPAWDPGIDADDPFGNPFSFTEQYVQLLIGNPAAVVDPSVQNVQTCDFQAPFATSISRPNFTWFDPPDPIIPDPAGDVDCFLSPVAAFIPTPAVAAAELADPNTTKMERAVTAAFKTPTLRNIELTGPYMHNGSMATLEEVIEFYTRLGNVSTVNTHGNLLGTGLASVPSLPPDDPINVTAKQNRSDLIALLKTFTDERVRFDRAPFDHPELLVPNGHPGDETLATGGNLLDPNLGADEILLIPAVGADGLPNPILSFESYLSD